MTPSTWPKKVLAVGVDVSKHFRGRYSEFLHFGINLQFVPSVADALSELAKDSTATVFVPFDLSDMKVKDFVHFAHILEFEVIVGLELSTAQPLLGILRGLGPVKTVMLPVSPDRLSQAVDRTTTSLAPKQRVIKAGALELDPAGFTILWHGRDVQLQASSFYLLHYLMEASPRTVTYEELVSEFVNPGISYQADAIRQRIARIRSALERAAPGAPIPLRTITRIGYRVISEDDPDELGSSSSMSELTYETISSRTRRTSAAGIPIGSSSFQSM